MLKVMAMKYAWIFPIYLLPLFPLSSYEVLGVGSPCVDLVYTIDDDFFNSVTLNKGDSQYIQDWDRFCTVLDKSHHFGRFQKQTTGGSSSNTIKALSSLEHRSAFLGKCGGDPSGQFYQKTAEKLKIRLIGDINSQDPTTQVAVFVSKDQQRTFLTYLSSSLLLSPNLLSEDLFTNVRLVHFEGYVINEFSSAFIEKAMQLAKKSGALVSFDLGCTRIAKNYANSILHLLQNYVDIVFANEAEVEALLDKPAQEGCSILSSYCSVSIVLMGKQGACISSKNTCFFSPAMDVDAIDTTGAGDLFASGFLHGYLRGYSLETCAWIGNLLGGTIVSMIGADIPEEQWVLLREKIKNHIEGLD